ncbi:MAG: hypothetical protein ACRDBG_12280, partial [Waterburya sp.]
KYITEFDAGNILYKAFPVRIVGGSTGGGGGSTSPTDIAAGIDLSADTETIKQNTTDTNLKLDSIDTKVTEMGADVEVLVDDFKSYSSPNTILVNPPLSGDIPLTLPKIGFYSLRVITGDLTGRFRILNGAIPLILHTPTTQTTDISSTFRDYYFWADSTSLTLDNISNNSLVSIALTPFDKFPSFNNSFIGIISLAANATSANINTFNFNYLSLDNPNFTINEVGVTSTPQYSGWIELRSREFTITNTTATAQIYRYKLSDNPNLASLNSVITKVIRPENTGAVDRCVIAGVDSSGLVKTPVLDAGGRLQVIESNSTAVQSNTNNTATNTSAIDTKLATVVTNTNTIATVINRDSKDYATAFTIFGSALSSFAVTSPINRYILKSAYLRNNSANILFIQLFNKSGGAPVAGDVPLLSIRLPANTSLFLGSDFLSPKGFLLPNISSGVVYWGQSSTESTFTPSVNNISITSFGVDRTIT